MGPTRRTHHVCSQVAHADRPAEGRTLARPAPPIKADREAGGSKVAAEGPRLRPCRPEVEEARRRAGADRTEAAGPPVVADGREGPGRILRPDRLEAAGVRKGQGGSRRRDEVGREISDLQKRMASGEPRITPEKVGRLAVLLRDKLYDGPPELRQAYARLLMDEVYVSEEEIRISGSKAVLARAASDGADMPAPAVLSFVREWRTRRDSNPWPLPSEGSEP